MEHVELLKQQFSPQADAYKHSHLHARGEDLLLVEEWAKKYAARAQVLDIGCGAGHASFCLARQAEAVTAYDLSEEMLASVANTAREYGLDNLKTVQGSSLKLPFADNSFDLVISRYSAHHWYNLNQALAEAARTLKPGGRTLFIDIISPETAVLDTFLQTVEILRDHSHIRDYSLGEWLQIFTNNNLHPVQQTLIKLRIDFTSYIKRMRTEETFVRAIRRFQETASREVREYFRIEDDGSFSADVLLAEAVKPA